MMKIILLDVVLALAILTVAALTVEGAVSILRRARRRRRSGGGARGVVIDRAGRVLGSYLDPFAHPWRAARLHGPESPWAPPARWGETPAAWEGFGETEEDAFTAANRLRRRHLQLFGLLEPDEGENTSEGWTVESA